MRQLVARHPPHDQPLLLQEGIAGHGLILAGKPRQHEIRHRRIRRHAQFRQRLGQPMPHPRILGPAARDEILIPDRRLRRLQLGGRQVERPPDPVQHINDRPGPIAPADPQPPQTIDLGKGPRHHDVAARLKDRQPAIIAFDIFRIGPVQHQNGLSRQPVGQPLDIGQRNHGAGGVVRIGDEDKLRAPVAGRQNGIDIRGAFPLGHFHRGRAHGQRRNPVHQETMFGEHHLILRPGIGLAEEGDDLVRSHATDHPPRIKAMHFGNRLAQTGMIGRGIAMQAVNAALECLFRAVRRAEGVFVRRKLDHIGHARDMRLPAFIKRDVQDTGLRSDGVGHVGKIPPFTRGSSFGRAARPDGLSPRFTSQTAPAASPSAPSARPTAQRSCGSPSARTDAPRWARADPDRRSP